MRYLVFLLFVGSCTLLLFSVSYADDFQDYLNQSNYWKKSELTHQVFEQKMAANGYHPFLKIRNDNGNDVVYFAQFNPSNGQFPGIAIKTAWYIHKGQGDRNGKIELGLESGRETQIYGVSAARYGSNKKELFVTFYALAKIDKIKFGTLRVTSVSSSNGFALQTSFMEAGSNKEYIIKSITITDVSIIKQSITLQIMTNEGQKTFKFEG